MSQPAPVVSPSPSLSILVGGRLLGPWGARTVGGVAGTDTVLAGDADALFTLRNDSSPLQTLRRVDPDTGRVLATRTGTHIEGRGVIVAGRLWVLVAQSQPHGLSFDMQALDPGSLATTAVVQMGNRTTSVDDADVAGAVGRTGRIYVVYNGHHIAVLDLVRARVVHRYSLPGGAVQAVVDPDGTRMYVVATATRRSTQTQTLTVRRPDTGALLFASGYRPKDGLMSPVAASRGGVWLSEGSGMTHNAAFHPGRNLGTTTHATGTSSGGLPLTVSVYSSVAWLGSETRLMCADPDSGTVRASINLNKAASDGLGIFDVTRAGSRLFADYATRADTERLVTISPPLRCRG